MDGIPAAERDNEVFQAFAMRIGAARQDRLAQVVLTLVGRLHEVARDLDVTQDDLSGLIAFLTEVGHSTDAQRQEWVLLADVLGLSTVVDDLAHSGRRGATPSTVAGPFYRPDAPDLPDDADLCRDGRGHRVRITGQVLDLEARPVPGASVEVWHANSEGCYENQEPDRQPEYNLRGRFQTNASGQFRCQTIRPKGYTLPSDGPVGRLFEGLGLTLERPAHIHFRITAKGFAPLVTHVFDRDDPAIGRDALFAVKPDLLGEFVRTAANPDQYALDVHFKLAPEGTQ